MKKLLFFWVGITLSFCDVLAQSSELHNKYSNTYIEYDEMIEYYLKQNEGAKMPDGPMYYYYNTNYGYLLNVKYQGEVRPIAKEKMDALDNHLKSSGFPMTADSLFADEVLVEDAGMKFWIPIQKQLFHFWEDELQKGNDAIINIRVYGSFESEEFVWLYSINSFESGNAYNALWNHIDSSMKSNEFKNAFNIINVLKEMQEDIEIYAYEGEVYYSYYFESEDGKHLENALKSTNTYLGKVKNDDRALYVKALILYEMKNFNEASECIQKAKKIAKKNKSNMLESIVELENTLKQG